jgi:uncharacterized protein (DUF4415 family)
MRKKPLTNSAGDVRELRRADLRRFRPASEVLPAALAVLLPKRKPGIRGPQKPPVKDEVTLRLDHDVVAHFKASGSGWQTRINSALRQIIKKTG